MARLTIPPQGALDLVGGGDCLASGLFYGLLSGASPEDAVRLGWAHGALEAFARGGSARIQR